MEIQSYEPINQQAIYVPYHVHACAGSTVFPGALSDVASNIYSIWFLSTGKHTSTSLQAGRIKQSLMPKREVPTLPSLGPKLERLVRFSPLLKVLCLSLLDHKIISIGPKARGRE